MNGFPRHNCQLHREREAVARCPSCKRFFCRECVTEHEGRVVCSACLRKEGTEENRAAWKLGGAWRAAQVAAGLALAWLAFYGLGSALVNIPSDFHDGVYWEFQQEWRD